MSTGFTSKLPENAKIVDGSSIVITGVPASVTREQLREALAVLGINPEGVVRFSADANTTAMEVEVYSDGRPDVPGWRWTHDGENVATHRLTIPIIDKEPTP